MKPSRKIEKLIFIFHKPVYSVWIRDYTRAIVADKILPLYYQKEFFKKFPIMPFPSSLTP